jgi:pilus assembly protein CpaB
MKVRGLAIAVAFLLAAGATGAVYLYVQGIQEDKTATPDTVSVIVSKKDIAAGTALDNLISSGAFSTLSIPTDALVQGAVTDVSQLEGQTTRFPILEGEQISVARLQNGTIQVAGGVLGIPKGHKAITLPLDLPEAVGGVVQAGDHVTIYATFQDQTASNGSLDSFLKGQPVEQSKFELGSFTITVVPDVQILKASVPSAEGTNNSNDKALLTMSLTPLEAQHVVFAQENGHVWLGLLPPDEKGTDVPAVSVLELVIK